MVFAPNFAVTEFVVGEIQLPSATRVFTFEAKFMKHSFFSRRTDFVSFEVITSLSTNSTLAEASHWSLTVLTELVLF